MARAIAISLHGRYDHGPIPDVLMAAAPSGGTLAERLAKVITDARAQGVERVILCNHITAADHAAIGACAAASDLAIVRRARPRNPLARCARWWASVAVWACTGRWPGDALSPIRAMPIAEFESVLRYARGRAWDLRVLVRALWRNKQLTIIDGRADRDLAFGLMRAIAVHWAAVVLLLRSSLPLRQPETVDNARRYACALGLGAGIGASPFIGLHSLLAGVAAWRFHLPPTVVLLGSNISFGPLLAFWAAVSLFAGHAISGAWAPWAVIDDIAQRLNAASDWSARWAVIGDEALLWLLGGVIIAPLVGITAGLIGYGLARASTHKVAA